MQLNRRHQPGWIEFPCEVEVTESEDGWAIMTPIAPLSIRRIGVSDSVNLIS